MQEKQITGFSKKSKQEKLRWVTGVFTDNPTQAEADLSSFWHPDERLQRIIDGFSENTVSNFPIPYGIAPNFVINGKTYAVPMVIEESSVVAAASSAAKYWMERGGFHAQVHDTVKLGQVHFYWLGDSARLRSLFPRMEQQLRQDAAYLTANMEQRGGGITGIELLDLSDVEPNLYQLRGRFDTCDSMGANFINSVLEEFAASMERFLQNCAELPEPERQVEIVMSILSNYTPECLASAWVECPVEQLSDPGKEEEALLMAERFRKAVRIAQIDPYRATTHNKGILNGIDAVVLATANDFRAVEACAHTYAARNGQYRSLSHCRIENGIFRFQLDVPLALGSVGGLTKLHPLAARSLEILGHPSATELMMIVASVGLAQNFAAVRSLVTTGIQKGHMRMHLMNILNHLGAAEVDMQAAFTHFDDKVVSFSAVRDFLTQRREAAPAIQP
jgi:hydroxymethylglutaryl-CoA reductase